MLLTIHILIIVAFILLGFLFRAGKGKFLIAGYNTASKKEKEKIDEKKLCRYMSTLMFVLAACWAVIACCEIFGQIWLLWVGFTAFLLAAIIGVIYINTGNRIKK
jgi:Na+/proline symporter